MQLGRLKRRDFITLIGGAAAWPLATRAQQPEKTRRIGVLVGLAESDPETRARLAGFRQGLEKRGWSEGRNVRIDYRFAPDSSADQAQALAKELIALQPDVILSQGTPPTAALQQETRAIPIVFAGIADPIGSGFVGSLPRPGSNLTGLMMFEYLRVAESVSPSLGIKLVPSLVGNTADIERAIESFAGVPNGGLLVPPDVSATAHRDLIIALAARYSLPAVYSFRLFVVAGGLMSYGVDFVDMFRQAASYVDRILRGDKPADLPVQAATKFETIVNLKTAKTLGLTVPPGLLVAADEVIE
jgi:putative ABC transport system substrate-binding protein